MIAVRRVAARLPTRSVGDVLVESHGVHVVLGGAPVLDGVDVMVRAGELVALVGPNGAGKSTLLGVLAGDRRPECGTVLIDGLPAESFPHGDLARRRAVVPQQSIVTFPFSVREVVSMGRAPWARTSEVSRDLWAIERAIVDADLVELADRPVPSLSGGERARVALARALAQEAQLVLLDEPTAALDIHHTEHVLAVLRDLVAGGSGVAVVLHDLGLAAAYADRVVVLAGGRIVADGPPCDVLEPALLSAVYGHPVDVISHPDTGALLVQPRRPGPSTSA